MRPTFAELAARLAAEGHAPDPALAPPAVIDDDPLPWFVRVLVGVGAWLSASFVLGLCGAIFSSALESVSLVLGLVLVGVGAAVIRSQRDQSSGRALFVRQGALAGVLAGQGLVIFGASQSGSEVVTALVAIGLAGATIFAVRDPVASFLSAFGACVALAWLLVELHVPRALDVIALAFAAAAGALWLSRPARFERVGQDALAPVAHAVTLALFGTLLFATKIGPFSDVSEWRGMSPPGHPAAVGLGLAAVALALVIRRDLGLGRLAPLDSVALAGLALLGPATPGAPGLAGALAALLMALHRREPLLLGTSVVFLVAFLGAYYYALAATLLMKALLLALAGAALLGGALVATRRRAS
jgi:hypothetical protein